MTVNKSFLAALPAVLTLAAPVVLSAPAQAGILHKHPTATGVAAGLAAHHLAKTHGHGMMHRHPVMTGMAAGMAAHHMAKKHM